MKKILDRIYKQLYNESDYNKEYSNIYKIHKYWSRKPWYIVEKYIQKFSKIDDLVLDPFMGSGCTGTEAIFNRRNFIGWDLNPISGKIAIGTSIIAPNISNLHDDFEHIKSRCFEQINSCYSVRETCPICEKKLSIKYICIGPKTKNKNLAFLYCPNCNKKTVRKEVINYDPEEKKYNNLLERFWKPEVFFPINFYKDRFSYKGIKSVVDMYTKRNLYCLCYLKDAIENMKLNYPELAMLAFTNTVLHASKLKGENVRPLSVNNYWVPDDYIEENVWFRFEDRYKNIIKGKQALNKKIDNKPINNKFECIIDSCLNMNYKESIDYVFTDPPYGDAIQYSELSFIYNAWLNETYDNKEEVIINPCQNKKETDFLDLIDKSMKKIYDSLKKDKYMTLCFQNKNFSIWKHIIDTCKKLGFQLEDISIYNTYGVPFNKYWSKFSPKSDIYVTFKKSDKHIKSRYYRENLNLESLIREIANYTYNINDNDKIYDLTVAYIIWSLYYNLGELQIDNFDLKKFIKYIEINRLRKEQISLDI